MSGSREPLTLGEDKSKKTGCIPRKYRVYVYVSLAILGVMALVAVALVYIPGLSPKVGDTDDDSQHNPRTDEPNKYIIHPPNKFPNHTQPPFVNPHPLPGQDPDNATEADTSDSSGGGAVDASGEGDEESSNSTTPTRGVRDLASSVQLIATATNAYVRDVDLVILNGTSGGERAYYTMPPVSTDGRRITMACVAPGGVSILRNPDPYNGVAEIRLRRGQSVDVVYSVAAGWTLAAAVGDPRSVDLRFAEPFVHVVTHTEDGDVCVATVDADSASTRFSSVIHTECTGTGPFAPSGAVLSGRKTLFVAGESQIGVLDAAVPRRLTERRPLTAPNASTSAPGIVGVADEVLAFYGADSSNGALSLYPEAADAWADVRPGGVVGARNGFVLAVDTDGTATVLSVAARETVATLKLCGGAAAVVFVPGTPETKAYVVCSATNTLLAVWRNADGKWKQQVATKLKTSSTAAVTGATHAAISPDGRFLYLSMWAYGEIRQYDVRNFLKPVMRGTLKISDYTSTSVFAKGATKQGPHHSAVSADGRWLYASSSINEELVSGALNDRDAASYLIRVDTGVIAGVRQYDMALDESFGVVFDRDDGKYRAAAVVVLQH